jgi:hypothetical protein
LQADESAGNELFERLIEQEGLEPIATEIILPSHEGEPAAAGGFGFDRRSNRQGHAEHRLAERRPRDVV